MKIDGEPAPVARSQVIATRGSVRVADIEDRYSTPAMLAAERELVDTAAKRVGEGTGVAGDAAIEAAVAARGYLSD